MFWKISCVAKTIFAHCSTIKLTVTLRKSLFVVIRRYNFRALLSSCGFIVIICFFCVSFSQLLLFNFHFMLCCRFWRIKMNVWLHRSKSVTTADWLNVGPACDESAAEGDMYTQMRSYISESYLPTYLQNVAYYTNNGTMPRHIVFATYDGIVRVVTRP